MLKKILISLFCVVVAMNLACAEEYGLPIFADSFDSSGTFAENWVAKPLSQIQSANGRVTMKGGTLRMRRDMPLEFYAAADITVAMDSPDNKTGFGGFMIEGMHFKITPAGSTFMVWKEKGKTRSSGNYFKINNFAQGKAVKLELYRTVKENNVRYSFFVNGKAAGTTITDRPVKKDEKYNPLVITMYKIDTMTVDDFRLYTVKKGADESPNLVVNSSFEHLQDGFPLFYSRNGINTRKYGPVPYETLLDLISIDEKVKHSGKYSLKMVVDENNPSQHIGAHKAGTMKDNIGVFSVWLKADRLDFPVGIRYGGRSKQVKVGKEWQRFEVVNTNLPAPGVYSPVSVGIRNTPGTLWVDDLQAEYLMAVDEKELKDGKVYASAYRVSELDKEKLAELPTPERAADINIPELSSKIHPTIELDSWKNKAVRLDKFYKGTAKAKKDTEAYLACDSKNIYLGYRCYVDDLTNIDMVKKQRDSFSLFSSKDSVEFFLSPEGQDKFFQFATDVAGTKVDFGYGNDVAWSGDWQSSAKINQKYQSIDFLITLPFSTFASANLSTRWLVNICRNDNSQRENVSIAKTPVVGFKQVAYWPYANFPADVIKHYAIGATSGGFSNLPDGGINVTLTVKNLTGANQKVEAELLDLQSSAVVVGKQTVLLKIGENSLTFHVKDPTQKIALKLWENGRVLSNKTLILKPANPLAMLGRLSFYMNEENAWFRVKTSVLEPEKQTAVLKCGNTVVRMPAAAKFKIALPLKHIADGTNTVSLSLENHGKTVASSTHRLIKRPYWEGATQINHFTRSLVHKGKPVFQFAPFIINSKHIHPKHIESIVNGQIKILNQYGFKYVHLLIDKRENGPEYAKMFLDKALENDIKIMLWTQYFKASDEELQKMLKEFNYPNILSQMVMDEPELGTPSDEALAFLRKMRKLFPYQPTHMNNTVMGIPNRYANLETDILMLDDYLTNRERRTVASVVDAVDIMKEAGAAEGKPCFYFLVADNSPLHGREPSYKEQIAQTYGCIGAGCTGLSYFYGFPKTQGNWKAYVQLNREILSLNDIILSEEEYTESKCDTDVKKLRFITCKHNGFAYIISCNIDRNALGKVAFELPADYRYHGKVEVLFENRQIKQRKGRFVDDFDGHSRHVYKIKIK